MTQPGRAVVASRLLPVRAASELVAASELQARRGAAEVLPEQHSTAQRPGIHHTTECSMLSGVAPASQAAQGHAFLRHQVDAPAGPEVDQVGGLGASEGADQGSRGSPDPDAGVGREGCLVLGAGVQLHRGIKAPCVQVGYVLQAPASRADVLQRVREELAGRAVGDPGGHLARGGRSAGNPSDFDG